MMIQNGFLVRNEHETRIFNRKQNNRSNRIGLTKMTNDVIPKRRHKFPIAKGGVLRNTPHVNKI